MSIPMYPMLAVTLYKCLFKFFVRNVINVYKMASSAYNCSSVQNHRGNMKIQFNLSGKKKSRTCSLETLLQDSLDRMYCQQTVKART